MPNYVCALIFAFKRRNQDDLWPAKWEIGCGLCSHTSSKHQSDNGLSKQFCSIIKMSQYCYIRSVMLKMRRNKKPKGWHLCDQSTIPGVVIAIPYRDNITVYCTVENQNLANSHTWERGNIEKLYVCCKLYALHLLFMKITV